MVSGRLTRFAHSSVRCGRPRSSIHPKRPLRSSIVQDPNYPYISTPPTTVTVVSLSIRSRIWCPGCGIELPGSAAHVWADTLWCCTCPPANGPHAAHLLRLLRDPRLAAHWTKVRGVQAYVPHLMAPQPLTNLFDTLQDQGRIDICREPDFHCPLLSPPSVRASVADSCPIGRYGT